MKISLENGVVLYVSHFTENGKRKTRREAIAEAAVRCCGVNMGGRLLDDSLTSVAHFDATGKRLAS
ncbi:hypothetical protein JQ760_028150 (plasmid) [Klebsiella pneumoniae]|uniref:hypothetical protein n=1 Tax=Klebsiella pneumoniae TaxID=573 RepID=UPI001FAC6537|nr:hypothetical protein [Klebsiella pneumoniae]MCI8108465.1 hypothetical protein [Klebsiella pneumoniae]